MDEKRYTGLDTGRILGDRNQVKGVEGLKVGGFYEHRKINDSNGHHEAVRTFEILSVNITPKSSKKTSTFRSRFEYSPGKIHEQDFSFADFGVVPTRFGLWVKGSYLVPANKFGS